MPMLVTAPNRVDLQGYVAPGFEHVRDTFAENFTRRHELGGACCAYHRGQKVVDIWGGSRNKQTRNPGSGTRWSSFTRPPKAWRR